MAILHISENEFEKQVLESEKPVLLDFFATWCGPCQMLAKELEALDKEQEAFRIVKVDIDENPGLTRQWEISTVPTVFMIKDGQVKDKAVGFLPKQLLKQKMENLA
ncbi:MAG TPA: thioredoxin [Candidatus Blautia pullicola]|uniref:Thioredoxin n=1 Tax=Candidatus Blautia pullicola TaxID=2838498 RepID=A0A9D2JR12_9FIRM|nr:thioredoxin [Candidatus Blautia pullicola]